MMRFPITVSWRDKSSNRVAHQEFKNYTAAKSFADIVSTTGVQPIIKDHRLSMLTKTVKIVLLIALLIASPALLGAACAIFKVTGQTVQEWLEPTTQPF